LAASGNQDAIKELSQAYDRNYNFLRAALAFENGMVDDQGRIPVLHGYDPVSVDLRDIQNDKTKCKMVALSILENDPDSPVLQFVPIKPKELMTSKPAVAENYMVSKRVDPEGQKIPSAHEIHSLPENPLSLVKGLFSLKDSAGLLVTLNLIAEKIASLPNSEVEYALEYTMSALKELGHAQEAQSILLSNKIRMDGNGWRKIMMPTSIPSQNVNIVHITDSYETGDMISAAKFTNLLFRRNPAAVMDVLSKLSPNSIFADMLDPAIGSSLGAPDWIKKKKDVEAAMLPNGIIVIGKSGIYTFFDGVKDHCYASSKIDSLPIAWEKSQG
jgi:hypothetical protein